MGANGKVFIFNTLLDINNQQQYLIVEECCNARMM
jgi:hypothetical protein